MKLRIQDFGPMTYATSKKLTASQDVGDLRSLHIATPPTILRQARNETFKVHVFIAALHEDFLSVKTPDAEAAWLSRKVWQNPRQSWVLLRLPARTSFVASPSS